MSRIFRCGILYASIEIGLSLACVTIEGKTHVVDARECRTALDCIKVLNTEHKGEWKWIA